MKVVSVVCNVRVCVRLTWRTCWEEDGLPQDQDQHRLCQLQVRQKLDLPLVSITRLLHDVTHAVVNITICDKSITPLTFVDLLHEYYYCLYLVLYHSTQSMLDKDSHIQLIIS